MAKLASSAAYKGFASARLLNAYSLALNDQLAAARAARTEARALATARFPSEHIIFYIVADTEAMLDAPRARDRARAASEAREPRRSPKRLTSHRQPLRLTGWRPPKRALLHDPVTSNRHFS